MDGKKKNFDVILKSNDSMNNFPNNKISHFTNQFPSGLQLNGEWMCAVKLIGYHRTWLNITERAGIKIWIRIVFNEYDENTRQILSVIRVIPEGSYTDSDSIIEMIYAVCESIYDTELKKVFSLQSILKLIYLKRSRKFVFNIIDKDVTKIFFTIHEQPGDQQLKKILGMDPKSSTITISRRRVYTLPLEVDFSKHIDNLWIYAPNLIHPLQIGEKRSDILAVVPVDNMNHNQGDYIHYNIENPMYLNVRKSDLSSIEILITDSLGEKIPFDDYSGPVVLTLNFKLTSYNIENIRMNHNNEEYVYLISDRCDKMYPNNTPANFTNNISTPLELYGDFEMCLCSVRYGKSWKQLTKSQIITLDFTFEDDLYINQSFDIEFEAGHYYHPNNLADIWNSKSLRLIKKPPPEEEKEGEGADDSDSDDAIPPLEVNVQGRSPFVFPSETRVEKPKKRRKKYQVVKLGSLVKMLYMKATRKYFFKMMPLKSGHPFKAKVNFLPRGTRNRPYYHQLLDLFGVILQRDAISGQILPESHILLLTNISQNPFLSNSPDLQDNTFNLFVTSPLVDLTVTGESSLRLLNIVPVEGRTNEYIYHTYKERHYTRVNTSVIRDITIQIVDSINQIVRFESFHVQKPTIVVLHFRRRV